MVVNQFGSVLVNPGVLGEFGRQVRREYVHKVGILDGDLCRSLLGLSSRLSEVYGKGKHRA